MNFIDRNDAWLVVGLLLERAGGAVTFTEEEIMRMRESKARILVDPSPDPLEGTVTLRLSAEVAA